jgi:hypothetical protein
MGGIDAHPSDTRIRRYRDAAASVDQESNDAAELPMGQRAGVVIHSQSFFISSAKACVLNPIALPAPSRMASTAFP